VSGATGKRTRGPTTGEFVGEEQQPAASEWKGRGGLRVEDPHAFVNLGAALRLPRRIQSIEEFRTPVVAARIAHATVSLQDQLVVWKRKQDVVPRMRTTLRRTFEESRVALPVCRRERQQIARAGQRAHYGR
jgi:hypothetical protein